MAAHHTPPVLAPRHAKPHMDRGPRPLEAILARLRACEQGGHPLFGRREIRVSSSPGRAELQGHRSHKATAHPSRGETGSAFSPIRTSPEKEEAFSSQLLRLIESPLDG